MPASKGGSEDEDRTLDSPQRQGRTTSALHGPQGPSWHARPHGWPHAISRAQTAPHVGTLSVQLVRSTPGVPGGKAARGSLPQGQVVMTSGARGQVRPPAGCGWQAESHGWRPHENVCGQGPSQAYRPIQLVATAASASSSVVMMVVVENDDGGGPLMQTTDCSASSLHDPTRESAPQKHVRTSSTAQGRHGPSWHGSAQMWSCFPQASRLPQGLPHPPPAASSSPAPDVPPQRTSMAWPCEPQARRSSTLQAGHGPGWQSSGHGWAHAGRGRLQGAAHECGVASRGGEGETVDWQKQVYCLGASERLVYGKKRG
jgi:hypothetical protein